MNLFTTRSRRFRWLTAIAVIVVVQAIAAAYFLLDAVLDIVLPQQTAHAFYHTFELAVALGLVAGVVLGTMVLRQMIEEARQRERAMALARREMTELVQRRFAEWGLTEAECEVALFALKGFEIAEIAALRQAATGTVRAQLSRIYVKAGVASHAMLIGSVIDEFLDTAPPAARDSAAQEAVAA